jgi:hypothetical protein
MFRSGLGPGGDDTFSEASDEEELDVAEVDPRHLADDADSQVCFPTQNIPKR